MSNDLLRLVVIAAVAFVAYRVLTSDGVVNPQYGGAVPYEVRDETEDVRRVKRTVHNQVQDELYKNNANVLPAPQMSNNFSPQGNFAHLDTPQLLAADLLPREGGFSESNPTPQGQLMNRNLFESGHHAGLNTQSSTLKNANLQLRSDPLIPRRDVGPWMQSTYESDTNRRMLEIGSA